MTSNTLSSRLTQTVDKIANKSDPQKILQVAAFEIANILNAEICMISIWDEEASQFIRRAAWLSNDTSLPSIWYQPQSVYALPQYDYLMKRKKSTQLIVGGTTIPTSTLHTMRAAGVQSILLIPMLGSDRIFEGVVEVFNLNENQTYAQEQVIAAEVITRLTTISMQKGQYVKDSQKKSHQIQSLMRAAGTVATTLSMQDVVLQVAEVMVHLFDVESCAISDYTPEDNRITLLTEYSRSNWETDPHRAQPYSLADFPVTKRVIENRQPIQLQTNMDDLGFAERRFMEEAEIQSLAMFPLVARGKTIGLLELMDSTTNRVFTDDELVLIEILASHAANALNNARLYESERHQRVLAEALQEAARAVNSRLEINAVLDEILRQLLLVLPSSSAIILLRTDDHLQVVRTHYLDNFQTQPVYLETVHISLKIASYKEMLHTREPILISDTRAYPKWEHIAGNEWIMSHASTPLIADDQVIGFLNIDSDDENFFDEKTISILKAFGAHAATAIHHAQIFEKTHQRANILEGLREASLALTASLDLTEVLNTILKNSLAVLPGLSNAHIFLYENGEASFAAAQQTKGASEKVWKSVRENGLTHTVAHNGQTIVVNDMANHPLFANMPKNKWGGSIAGLPLKYHDSVVGVMNIAHPHINALDDHHIRFLELLSDQAAIAIINARLHKQVSEQARTDVLTQLPNRRAFDERFQIELERCERYHHSFSLVMMDLNGFKKVNDTYGHPAGDTLLQQVAKRLYQTTRNTDFLARYGGDEFIVIMPETSLQEAEKLLTRIQTNINGKPFTLEHIDTDIDIAITIGLAVYPLHAISTTDLLKAADKALYKAKEQGVPFFTSDSFLL